MELLRIYRGDDAKRSMKEGDMMTEEEIIALQCNQPANMEAVAKPSRRFVRNQKKQHK